MSYQNNVTQNRKNNHHYFVKLPKGQYLGNSTLEHLFCRTPCVHPIQQIAFVISQCTKWVYLGPPSSTYMYIFILIHVKMIHNLWFIGLSWDCDEMLFQFPGKSLDFAALVENVALWSTICGWDLELNVEGGNRVLSLVGLTAPQVLVIGSMIIFLSLSSNSRALTTPETPEMIKNFIKTWHQFNDVWKYYRENTEYEARNSKIKKKIENNERFRRWWYIILGLMMRYWCSDCLVCILLDFIVVLNGNCWIIFFHEIENWLLENNYIEVMIHRILKIQQFLLRIC